jgi:hypothetical protein
MLSRLPEFEPISARMYGIGYGEMALLASHHFVLCFTPSSTASYPIKLNTTKQYMDLEKVVGQELHSPRQSYECNWPN